MVKRGGALQRFFDWALDDEPPDGFHFLEMVVHITLSAQSNWKGHKKDER